MNIVCLQAMQTPFFVSWDYHFTTTNLPNKTSFCPEVTYLQHGDDSHSWSNQRKTTCIYVTKTHLYHIIDYPNDGISAHFGGVK